MSIRGIVSRFKSRSDPPPMGSENENPKHGVRFEQHSPRFASIIGQDPRAVVLCQSQSGEALFHEACIYHKASRSIFVTSNQLGTTNEPPYHKVIGLYRIYDSEDPAAPATVEPIVFPEIKGAMLNGGVNYTSDSILLCAQGSAFKDDLSGIIELTIPPKGEAYAKPQVLTSNFHGLPFNSVNDVIVHPIDQSIWFTDPHYGYHQGIRPKPSLPNQVYRFDPATNSIRAIADGFTRPNGLCFSPDLKTLYVTDTGGIHGSPDIELDPAGPSHIYAFDIVYPGSSSSSSNSTSVEPSAATSLATLPITPSNPSSSAPSPSLIPYLTNRRLFAFAPGRCPDGIKTDVAGNVYSGCGDGIEVWDPYGDPLGVIGIPGGVANFCFGERGVIYACNESKFFKIWLDGDGSGEGVKGALLGL